MLRNNGIAICAAYGSSLGFMNQRRDRLVIADALGVAALGFVVHIKLRMGRRNVSGIVFPIEQAADKRHSHKLAVLHLAEIGGTRIIVHLGTDFIHSWQRMEHSHTGLGQFHLFLIEHKTVLDPLELLFVQEPFLLNPCHIQHVEFSHHFLYGRDLAIPDTHPFTDVLLDIAREPELERSYEDDLDVSVPGQSLDKGMHGAPELEVSAETDRDAVDMPQFPLDCQKVGKCLCRMGVGTVTCIDDRNLRIL